MSHRPEDRYAYIAKEDVFSGTVRAFAAGDPVPDETVEALGLLDSGQVCHRDDYERPEGEETPARAARRGEMPPHLQTVTPSADTGSSREKTKEDAESNELTRPSSDDTKSVWVDYATDERNSDRLSREEANGMTKSALMERYK